MIYIRNTAPDSPRAEEWAHLFFIQHNEDGKDIWIVEFPDGATDAWPAWDLTAQYDVKVQIEVPEPVEEPSGNHSNEIVGTAFDAARRILAQARTRRQDG